MKNILFLISFLLRSVVAPVCAQLEPLFYAEGHIKNKSGKGIKATIEILSLQKIIKSDKEGKFLLGLASGSYILQISAPNYKSQKVLIQLYADTTFGVVLDPLFHGILLGEIKIKSKKNDKVQSDIAGVETLSKLTIEKMPALLGEKDPLKAFQLMPGVSRESEGSAEINVRGGGTDQNLILLDDIPLYNSTHLFGLYSTFNHLAISQATLYKGDFPVSFGGKLSSVMVLNTTDTLTKKFGGQTEVGFTSVKFSFSIPTKKHKSTLYLSGRRSFYDTLLKIFGSDNVEPFAFQDYNIGYVYRPNQKNRLKLTIYHEGDAVGLTSYETSLIRASAKKNQSAFALSWRSRRTDRFKNDALIYYNKSGNQLLEEKRSQEVSYNYNFNTAIEDLGFKNTLTYDIPKLTVFAGIEAISHRFMPTRFFGHEQVETFDIQNLNDSRALDLSLFTESKIALGKDITMRFGIRNTNYFANSRSYYTAEPRIHFRWELAENASLKISFASTSQAVQRLTNPGLGLPQDILISADSVIQPQRAEQFSMEFAKTADINGRRIQLSISPFFKKLHRIIPFKDGFDTRNLIFNAIKQVKDIHDLITFGEGRAYGLEFMGEKKEGKFNGWINYTFLKTTNRFEELNEGLAFAPRQDKRHSLKLVTNWQISTRWNVGATWVFISGQPANAPENVFRSVSVDYSSGEIVENENPTLSYTQGLRGNLRMKPFHKLDISAECKRRIFGLEATLNFGLYNAYSRANPSFYYLGKTTSGSEEKTRPALKSVSLFPTIPSASLRLNF